MIASLLLDVVTVAAGSEKITIDDIEARFRRLQGEATDAVKTAGPPTIGLAALGAVLLLLAMYYFGRRRGRQQAPVLEICRTI
jgi:hypothetical protein